MRDTPCSCSECLAYAVTPCERCGHDGGVRVRLSLTWPRSKKTAAQRKTKRA